MRFSSTSLFQLRFSEATGTLQQVNYLSLHLFCMFEVWAVVIAWYEDEPSWFSFPIVFVCNDRAKNGDLYMASVAMSACVMEFGKAHWWL